MRVVAQRHRDVGLDAIRIVVNLDGLFPIVRRTADLLRKVAPQGGIRRLSHRLDERGTVRTPQV